MEMVSYFLLFVSFVLMLISFGISFEKRFEKIEAYNNALHLEMEKIKQDRMIYKICM